MHKLHGAFVHGLQVGQLLTGCFLVTRGGSRGVALPSICTTRNVASKGTSRPLLRACSAFAWNHSGLSSDLNVGLAGRLLRWVASKFLICTVDRLLRVLVHAQTPRESCARWMDSLRRMHVGLRTNSATHKGEDTVYTLHALTRLNGEVHSCGSFYEKGDWRAIQGR